MIETYGNYENTCREYHDSHLTLVTGERLRKTREVSPRIMGT